LSRQQLRKNKARYNIESCNWPLEMRSILEPLTSGI
jgi:hypothetical protein